MRYLLYISTIFFFVQCTPKVTEQVTETPAAPDPMAWRAESPEAGPARSIDMGEYNVFEMENGLTVIVVENHKLPRVSYQLSLKNNPVLEGDQAGYLGFTGHLLGRGTSTRSKADIDKSIDFIGANLNTSWSGIFGGSLTKHQDALLDVFTDVLYNPTFPTEEFEKIKTQALSGIQTSKTDPNAIASNVASVVNYGSDHPYGEVETETTLNSVDINNCKNYYQTYFKPNNAYLTIVGDISPIVARAKAEKYFGSWERGEVSDNNYENPQAPSEPRVCVANRDGAVQSVIRVTYPVNLYPGTTEALHTSVMNTILGGGGFSSRLLKNLREDKAFTYGAGSSIGPDRMVASFNASASVRNEVTDSSVTEFIYEMNRIATEQVSAEDLQLAKNIMAGGFARSLESPQTIARFAQNVVRYNLPEDYYETYLERLEAVTVEDVLAAANKYIRPGNVNIVVVGSKDDISESLVQFDGDGEIEYFDAFGKKLEVSDVALPADLTGDVVIGDFLNAMGGADKLKSVKSLEYHYGMSLMGQTMNVDIYQKAPNMMAMKVGNESMVMQETKFDGTTAFAGGMGGSQKATEGPVFEQAKSQAVMFEQLNYLDGGYTLELKGLEDVEGENCYKVSVTSPAGDKTTEFYSAKTNLLVRTVEVQEMAPGQTMTITNDMKDYKQIDGISFPHKLITTGAMPVPLEMNATSIKVNPELDNTMFTVE